MAVRLYTGLPEKFRLDAAHLYWQAFGTKLGRVMGPDDKAIAFLALVIRTDHAIVALDDDRALLGFAGFKTHAAAFAGGDFNDMVKVYGTFGAMWRAVLLSFLERDLENERFLLDGLCVAETARGRGIGTALLDAISAEALARGYRSVRLDVIASNPRARRLYERMGFRAVKTDRLGLLRHVFGFESSTAMVRDVA